ncbi:bacillithiol biosynthesis cysteine-adding enzyme BshC [Nemorincola caseinilytica]|uniref:bacillithiol biosynthesis cysteine-adding enzyme BshC n=1 Tax=Nemorincola caseinilytica TaxID=2054315 RepID=UPI0031EDB5B7
MTYAHIPYADTGYFSKLVADHISGHAPLRPFYDHAPDEAGIAQAIQQRANFPVDRQRLVSALERQYRGLEVADAVTANIRSLLSAHTYTVTTAHQPNLLTGYLYFIYKILHAIKLAEHLNATHAGKHFVPVYYMGSEDNDIEELGVFRFRGDKYIWDGSGQKGAVGRMDTSGLKPLLQRVFHMFGPPGRDMDDLVRIVTKAYMGHKTIGKATQYLVNELFGRYGLVILDPDDRELKEAFVPVMEDELLNSNAYPIVSQQTTLLEEQYKAQAFPRPINLFYLDHGIRERIERQGDKWVVLNTDISFSREELLAQLHEAPESFSPNVVLRGLFQSTILPDVVFIGGGAEVAYWFQLKTLFRHYNVFYPVVMLRRSVQWIAREQARLRHQCGISIADIFRPELQLETEQVDAHTSGEWRTGAEMQAIEDIFAGLQAKATAIDPTLGPSAAAALARMRRQAVVLEKKMLRAEKRKIEVGLQRLHRLKAELFPNGSLQERTENFAEYYLSYGPAFFDIVKEGIDPLNNRFLVIEQPAEDK